MLNLLDVCAGIGSFSLAAHRHNIKTVAQIEVDEQRRNLLSKHFPDVLRLEDIRDVTTNDIPERIEILAGGTPCQDLSVFGKREGLDGEKSQIWYEYLRLVAELKPQWVVWENVPGALSSNNGRDFATVLMGLDELRYHVAWRVLDAQYFGVPQRRRRLFLLGNLRDGRSAQVLFNSKSLHGGNQSQHKTQSNGSRIFGTLTSSAAGISRTGGLASELDYLVYNATGVRRLTPLECERLQGYPDNWTEGYSDSARYAMLGDSIAVPCSEWIIKRIKDNDHATSNAE